MRTIKYSGFALFLLLVQPVLANEANPSNDPTAFKDMALKAAAVIDSGGYQKIWKEATKHTQNAVNEKTFVSQVDSNRQAVGSVKNRAWRSITQVQMAEQSGNVNPGHYVNVNFNSTFSDGRQGNELVSFRKDEDGKWRFSGYVATLNK